MVSTRVMCERDVVAARSAQIFGIRGNRRDGSIWSHPWALSVNTTMPGSSRLGSSRLPAARKTKSARPLVLNTIGEPQVGQKPREETLPLSAAVS
jgi:hypothetical protein